MGDGTFDIANRTSGRLRGIHDTTLGTYDVAERRLIVVLRLHAVSNRTRTRQPVGR